jgi:hypothetical protein
MNLKRILFASFIAISAAFLLPACEEGLTCPGDPGCPPIDPTVITDDGSGIGNRTFEDGQVYILSGFCFVNPGQTLQIEPGAVLKFKPGQGANSSALIVARGGKINARGTAAKPIIFTAEQDDLSTPNDIPANTTGLWGGIILLGNAKLNSTPGETAIEGIPTSESRGLYGGNDDTDNSGVFAYASIRYGGTDIGAGNEINGLTLGGVGSGTEIHHVEVIYNADDGVEFFGGKPNTKNMVVAFCGDDSYDYDEGFRGNGQFWFTIQSPDAGSDRCGEHDGGTTPETAMPYAKPVIYNATYIGSGDAQGTRMITFRDNAGGEYHNSIFIEQNKGIDIELLGGGTPGNIDHSYDQFSEGNLKLVDNVFWNVAGNDPSKVFGISPAKYGGISIVDSTAEVDAAKAALIAYFVSAGNTVANPNIMVSYNPDGGLNPVPSGLSAGSLPADSWFDNVTYKGAFGSENWLKGWTFLDEMGYLQ